MYNKFFGFKEKPFKLVPNPEYLFLSKSHEEALAHLTYAISQGEGFVEITGEVGTGKTTLCRVFLENLDKSIEVAYIFNPKLDALQLLKVINDELGVDSAPDNTKDLIDRLNEFLIRKKGAGQKVLVLIDEAQNLSLEVLEQLRLLSNLETTKEKLLQIVLVGQPELSEMLSSHQLRQLGQRITINSRLLPLTYPETRDYIRHRIALASHRAGPSFDKASYRAIYEYSRGIPRLVNIACDRTLLNAFSRNSFSITGAITREAIVELTRKKPASSPRLFHTPAGLVILLAIFIPLTILLLYFARGELPVIPTMSQPPAPEQAAQAEIKPPVQPEQPGPVSAEELTAVQPEEAGSSQESSAGLDPEVSPGGDAEPVPPEQTATNEETGIAKPDAADSPTAASSPEEAEKPAADVDQPQNSMDSQTYLNFLRGLDTSLSRDNALAAILKLWFPAKEITLKYTGTGPGLSFFQDEAIAYGLQVQPLATASDLALIQTLNLPAIFTFYLPGDSSPRYLAVTGIDPEKVYFSAAGPEQTASVDRDVFLRSWSGEASIFWKNFNGLPGIISQRSGSEEIGELKYLLRQLGYGNISMNGRYDQEALKIIKDVQTKYGLQIDGLVGPFTKIALYNESPVFSKPSLAVSGAAGKMEENN